jgi:lipoyl(octanoyl) transferase
MEVLLSKEPVNYNCALSYMKNRVAQIARGEKVEAIWLLTHNPIYTIGARTKTAETGNAIQTGILISETNRGGKITYHGPGQRIVYFMLDTRNYNQNSKPNISHFVYQIEELIINALNKLGVHACRNTKSIGIWAYQAPLKTSRTTKNISNNLFKKNYQLTDAKKIASIGFRFKKYISYHGVAINLYTDLWPFQAIKPCGLPSSEISSLKLLNYNISMEQFDEAIIEEVEALCGKRSKCTFISI